MVVSASVKVGAGQVTVMEDPHRVSESICSLKVAVIFWLAGTGGGGAPLTGFSEMTVGAVVFALALVVKVYTKLLARKTPVTLSTPVVIVTLYVVLGRSKLEGVKIPILFVAS